MSSPNTAFTGCSRLSAYLTWGCLSMREVLQTSRTHSGRGVGCANAAHERMEIAEFNRRLILQLLNEMAMPVQP